MKFPNPPPLKYPAVYAAADVIIFRNADDADMIMSFHDIELLTAVRQIEPHKGSLAVPMGGYLDPEDTDVQSGVVREAKEETGLDVGLLWLVGVYGPERYVWKFGESPLQVTRTDEPAQIRPVISFVFAGRATGGVLRENNEQKEFHWMRAWDLLKEPVRFDHARQVSHFLHQLTGHRPTYSLDSIG